MRIQPSDPSNPWVVCVGNMPLAEKAFADPTKRSPAILGSFVLESQRGEGGGRRAPTASGRNKKQNPLRLGGKLGASKALIKLRWWGAGGNIQTHLSSPARQVCARPGPIETNSEDQSRTDPRFALSTAPSTGGPPAIPPLNRFITTK